MLRLEGPDSLTVGRRQGSTIKQPCINSSTAKGENSRENVAVSESVCKTFLWVGVPEYLLPSWDDACRSCGNFSGGIMLNERHGIQP